MSRSEEWAHFFKPEVRKLGLDYFNKDAVFLSIAADTQIQAVIKASSRPRVTLTAVSIASTSFDARCTCPSAKKGQFCKHIWATVLKVEKSYPDFLDSKKEISLVNETENRESEPARQNASQNTSQNGSPSASQRQADYRKRQYEKQKAYAKARRDEKKGKKTKSFGPAVPDEAQRALDYFSENGFALTIPLSAADLVNARKILARVFHPDKGGTHAEALELNENYEILLAWSER